MSMDSILDSIKKLLGVADSDDSFDDELVLHINGALLSATLIGVGPADGFSIKNAEDMWQDFIGERMDLEAVKTYIGHKVRLSFDPPQTGPMVEAINNQIKELEWKLNAQIEFQDKEEA